MARRDEPEGDQWQREERAQQLRRVEGEAVIEGCSEEGTFAVDPERRSIHAGRHCSKPSQVADDVDYEGRKICAEDWILMEDRDCWSSVRVLAAFDPTTESDVWIVWPGLRASDNMKSS